MRKKSVIKIGPVDRLTFGIKSYKCVLGKSGITAHKKEGDGATPSGKFPIRRVYYRPDRIPEPKSVLPVFALLPNDGWCDDPTHKDYNKKVTLPHEGHAESLWRSDELYDVFAVIGYNDEPALPHKGSAIFLHVAHRSFRHTQGCVALRIGDLIEVIEALPTNSQINILKP